MILCKDVDRIPNHGQQVSNSQGCPSLAEFRQHCKDRSLAQQDQRVQIGWQAHNPDLLTTHHCSTHPVSICSVLINNWDRRGQVHRWHLEWINHKVMLYSTRNYIQSPGINHNGKEYFKKGVYVYNWVTLLYNREWLTIINQLCFN